MEVHFTPPHMRSDLQSVLRRRGLVPQRTGDVSRTLYPIDNWEKIREEHGLQVYQQYFPKAFLPHYMERFGKSTFRKMIRRLLKDGRKYVEVEELRSLAKSSTDDYLTYLERTLLIDREGSRVRLIREINDIGSSLEHYVSMLCETELSASADWNVLLENLPRSGGDFDVLAWIEPSFVYIECKSSRPSKISEAEIREFLQRSSELAPDLAILLVDTDDDLTPFVRDFVNPILSEGLESPDEASDWIKEQNNYPRLFYGPRNLYVINSRYTILAQLRSCLQHYYRYVKWASFYSEDEEAPNYTGNSLYGNDVASGNQ